MKHQLLYNERHYDTAANLTREGWTPADQNRLETMMQLVPEGIQTLLDIGSGTGVITQAFRDRGLAVVATDYSEMALRRCEGPRVLGDCQHLPFRDLSFDMIVCAEVLEHLDDGRYRRALAEITRVTCVYALIAVPNAEDLNQIMVRCRSCSEYYTLYGHLRTFHESAMPGLLPGFRPVRSVFSGECTDYGRFLLWIRHHIGHTYAYWEHAICPKCGQPPERGRSLVAMGCDYVNNRMPWHRQRRSHIHVLYKRANP